MSLYVLDTDIVSLYQHGHALVCRKVDGRLITELAITVITVEEQLAGWYTAIRQARQRDQLALMYERLAMQVTFLARWPILVFPAQAIARYEHLLTLRLNVAKSDLRIAAITLENGGILVTRNVRDFQRVPGLVLEDWSV